MYRITFWVLRLPIHENLRSSTFSLVMRSIVLCFIRKTESVTPCCIQFSLGNYCTRLRSICFPVVDHQKQNEQIISEWHWKIKLYKRYHLSRMRVFDNSIILHGTRTLSNDTKHFKILIVSVSLDRQYSVTLLFQFVREHFGLTRRFASY